MDRGGSSLSPFSAEILKFRCLQCLYTFICVIVLLFIQECLDNRMPVNQPDLGKDVTQPFSISSLPTSFLILSPHSNIGFSTICVVKTKDLRKI